MRMPIKLLAADMDGTLLNSRKTISPGDVSALNRALEAGKTVVFATGRSLAELNAFFPLFPRMRYVLGESGALIYDLEERRAIHRQRFDAALVRTIRARLGDRDVMPQILINDLCLMNRRDVANLSHFHMAHYQNHFDATGTHLDDAWAECAALGWEADKICLYHVSPEDRSVTRAALEDLSVVLVDAEETSLEVSPVGVDKGVGLELLCRHLGLERAQVLAVGDSYNDLTMLRAAGLSVAMGNAVDAVKAVCDAVVADNDHCGVAEAVERFLL